MVFLIKGFLGLILFSLYVVALCNHAEQKEKFIQTLGLLAILNYSLEMRTL